MLCRSFIYHVYFRKYRRTKLTPSFWIKLYIGLSFVLLLSVLKPMTCTDFRVLAWRNHEVFRSVWPVSVPAHELGFFFEGEAGCASVLHMLYLRKLSTGRPLPVLQSSWNVMAHGDARGGGVKGKLANGVGSQYPSHYLGTWCIQHYYRWCAHLGCQ